MQRRYYRLDGMGAFAPNAGVPMHQSGESAKQRAHKEQIITPQLIENVKKNNAAVRDEKEQRIFDSVFRDGKLLGRYETDDIILLCIIVVLLQNKEDTDTLLLIALAYIFLSDKDFFKF